jgi:hypothetical protein
MLLRKTGMPLSSDNFQLARGEKFRLRYRMARSNTYRFSRRPLHRTSLLRIYVPRLRSRQFLTLWRPSWRIVTSFILMLRSVERLSRLQRMVTPSKVSRRISFSNLYLLRIGMIFVMRFGRSTFSCITTTTYPRFPSSRRFHAANFIQLGSNVQVFIATCLVRSRLIYACDYASSPLVRPTLMDSMFSRPRINARHDTTNPRYFDDWQEF